ncbi:MAG: cysteine desulfurase [Kiritimatiellae bacterium]|nr:cysteine desulfurase [Kiritimatiellia bacterium]
MIYWDHNSTTPCAPEVIEAMKPYWDHEYGNPSSSHIMGRRASTAIRKAREQVANLANALPSEIIFTSGATESNNLLFLGILLTPKTDRNRIVVSSIEHKSILEPVRLLAEHGFEVLKLPVSECGVTDLNAAKELINGKTLLVSVQGANNELGTLQPVCQLAEIAHTNGAYFHTDAAQVLGKISFNTELFNCDFASFSAHKMYGPKGIGALFIRGGAKQWPWSRPFGGGGQESGLRPGTQNVPGIVGFGMACEISQHYITNQNNNPIHHLEKILIQKLFESFPTGHFVTRNTPRLPGVVAFSFPNISADLLMDNIKTLCIGKGSACTNGAISQSHVLNAIGYSHDFSRGTFRVSLGRETDLNEIQESIILIQNAFHDVQRISKQNEK